MRTCANERLNSYSDYFNNSALRVLNNATVAFNYTTLID